MSDRSTFGDSAEAESESLPLLVPVLTYEDLLAPPGPIVSIGRSTTFTVGRAPSEGTVPKGLDLVLDDRWVSTTHAIFRKKASGAIFIEDVESRNGTFVNGERVEGPQRMFDGDLVEIGHSLFCFRLIPNALADLTARAPEGAMLGPTPTRCAELVRLREDLARVAGSRQAVLVLGETGAGKEVLARALHDESGRKGAFRALDCGAIPESLFEATFFGHRRGAFTGAADSRTGEIVRAHQGTLFLDEVSNMSQACQAKLLRVIEEGTVTALGASDPETVDVRWVAATNADPFDRGTAFRADLLQRLAGFTVRLPPLRRRREDLGVLAAHFLRQAGRAKASITAPAGRRLFADGFAGNVRQLRAQIQTAALLAGDGPIQLEHLPPRGADTEYDDTEPERRSRASGELRVAADTVARAPDPATLVAALQKTSGNVIRAAELLAVRPRQLYRWIARFEIDLDQYRGGVR